MPHYCVSTIAVAFSVLKTTNRRLEKSSRREIQSNDNFFFYADSKNGFQDKELMSTLYFWGFSFF